MTLWIVKSHDTVVTDIREKDTVIDMASRCDFRDHDNDTFGETKRFFTDLCHELRYVDHVCLVNPSDFYEYSPVVFCFLLSVLTNRTPFLTRESKTPHSVLCVHIINTPTSTPSSHVTHLLDRCDGWVRLYENTFMVRRSRVHKHQLLVVTAIYDTDSLDDTTVFGQETMWDSHLVVFTPRDLVSRVRHLVSHRPPDKTIILETELNDLDAPTQWSSFLKKHSSTSQDYVRMNTLFFVRRAIEHLGDTPFQRVMWVDPDLSRLDPYMWALGMWVYTIPDKIRFMCVSPLTDVLCPYGPTRKHFDWERSGTTTHDQYEYISGRLVSGSPDSMLWFCSMMEEYVKTMFQSGYCEPYHMVWTRVFRDFHWMFSPYFGEVAVTCRDYRSPHDEQSSLTAYERHKTSLQKYKEKCVSRKQDDGQWITAFLEKYFFSWRQERHRHGEKDMNRLNRVVFVTGIFRLYPTNDETLSFEKRMEYFLSVARLDVDIYVYTDDSYFQQLCDVRKIYPRLRIVNIHSLSHTHLGNIVKQYTQENGVDLRLPLNRNALKDTKEFLLMINTKMEFLQRTIHSEKKRDPFHNKTYYYWFDFSLCKVFKNIKHALNDIMTLHSVHLKERFLYLPGCWETAFDDDLYLINNIVWRFAGGVIMGDEETLAHFYTLLEQNYKRFFSTFHTLVWEVNYWAWIEKEYTFPIVWQNVGHDDTIVSIPESILECTTETK